MSDVWPLFVGRFQPFHRGHLAMVKRILEEHNGITFGVGSSQFKDTQKNPFSFEERARMIRSAMEREGFEDYDIVAIRDLNDDELWVKQVKELIPNLFLIYSNDPLTVRLFRERGFDVRVMPLVERNSLSGTKVRKRILDNTNWEEFVPPPVRDILVEIEGPERIRRLAGQSSEKNENEEC
ncbi:MAG: nicotinamide-nucleotide adenylyltransferase [Thermoplasmata archaeon]